MTLLITVFSAIISTVIWYTKKSARELKCGTLCYMFWGASLMWLVDAAVEYLKIGAEYFQPNIQDMLNDTFLGFSVVAFALAVWLVLLLVKDPKKILEKKQ